MQQKVDECYMFEKEINEKFLKEFEKYDWKSASYKFNKTNND